MEPRFREVSGEVPYFSGDFLSHQVYLHHGGGGEGQKAVGMGDLGVRPV